MITSDGTTRQSFTTTLSPIVPGPPELRNLADDGRDQLVIPNGGGTGGPGFDIYRATDAAPDFVYTGSLQGIANVPIAIQRTADGYVSAMSKSGPSKHYRQFYHFVGSRLELVAHVLITIGGNPECGVDDEGERGDSGLSDAEVVQRFCAEQTYPAIPVQ
ncbi:hypothetical protein ACFXHA_32020 [Nocardia sp. NPDC059240]|uniref:hypothetical protein n=1 Tax=Nocardia sp. NPDC059240 TaxID=3346786 RepID=UPI00369DB56E